MSALCLLWPWKRWLNDDENGKIRLATLVNKRNDRHSSGDSAVRGCSFYWHGLDLRLLIRFVRSKGFETATKVRLKFCRCRPSFSSSPYVHFSMENIFKIVQIGSGVAPSAPVSNLFPRSFIFMHHWGPTLNRREFHQTYWARTAGLRLSIRKAFWMLLIVRLLERGLPSLILFIWPPLSDEFLWVFCTQKCTTLSFSLSLQSFSTNKRFSPICVVDAQKREIVIQ